MEVHSAHSPEAISHFGISLIPVWKSGEGGRTIAIKPQGDDREERLSRAEGESDVEHDCVEQRNC